MQGSGGAVSALVVKHQTRPTGIGLWVRVRVRDRVRVRVRDRVRDRVRVMVKDEVSGWG